MPERENRSAPRVPKYPRYNAGGRDRAYCWIHDGVGKRRRVYLGKWDSPESKRSREIVGRHLLNGGSSAPGAPVATMRSRAENGS